METGGVRRPLSPPPREYLHVNPIKEVTLTERNETLVSYIRCRRKGETKHGSECVKWI